MGPDWLGSPQHAIAGTALAFVVALVTRRSIAARGLVLAFAVGVTATAEIVVEILEYPLLYSGRLNAAAYYDTIVDMASTLAGSLAGAVAGLLPHVRARRR